MRYFAIAIVVLAGSALYVRAQAPCANGNCPIPVRAKVSGAVHALVHREHQPLRSFAQAVVCRSQCAFGRVRYAVGAVVKRQPVRSVVRRLVCR